MNIDKWLEKSEVVITPEIENFFLNFFQNLSTLEIDFVNKNIKKFINIIHIFSNDPLVTQKNILEVIKVNKKDLVNINKFLRNNSEVQNIVLKKGSGQRYWNSILPFANYTKNVINNIYNFPLRIAFFPGVSCMFYCGFCGRNQNAKYPLNTSKEGILKLKSVINEIQDNTAISISGGLEPLTNMHLGELISYAKEKNLRVPLITNAYSLTQNYLSKNQGIWDLDSLRISLYGVDEESYQFVTRSPKSFKIVKENAINFLKSKIKNKSKVKLGFNYIILKNNLKDIRKLCQFLKVVSQESECEIDFLTLREDFGSVTGHDQNIDIQRKYRFDSFIDNEDRKFLRDELFYLEDFKKKELKNMNIDYGYALKGLLDNKLNYYLLRAKDQEVTRRGYPQLSVAIDLYGDVFLYREAGFLNREGNEKYIIGRLSNDNSLEMIIKKHLQNYIETTEKNSTRFLDSFDHLLTKLVYQAKEDKEIGIPFELGPILERSKVVKINLGNNWYS